MQRGIGPGGVGGREIIFYVYFFRIRVIKSKLVLKTMVRDLKPHVIKDGLTKKIKIVTNIQSPLDCPLSHFHVSSYNIHFKSFLIKCIAHQFSMFLLSVSVYVVVITSANILACHLNFSCDVFPIFLHHPH